MCEQSIHILYKEGVIINRYTLAKGGKGDILIEGCKAKPICNKNKAREALFMMKWEKKSETKEKDNASLYHHAQRTCQTWVVERKTKGDFNML